MTHPTKQPRDIVAIGASAGGIEAISRLLVQLPADLPAAVIVVMHRTIERPSVLPVILSRWSNMRVVVPRGSEPLEHGTCFIGTPDQHLIVDAKLRLGALLDGFYRSHNIDALFCTLALHAGPRTIGVVLTGALKDGTLGLRAIKEAGGVALVQSPEEALHPGMPRSAIEHGGPVDLIAPVDLLAKEILRLVNSNRSAAALRPSESPHVEEVPE